MSRIGKNPIPIPNGVEVTVDKSNVVTVKGPKGQLTQKVDPDIIVEVQENTIQVKRPTDQKRHKAMHGLYRSLIANMVEGVSKGYVKELELIGVGYRVSNQGNLLEIHVGYSHPILFVVPEELKVSTEMKKGSPPLIRLEGIDKQLIGEIAAKIRSFRKPEPYKGKGIRYKGEVIRRKVGKMAGK